VAAEEATLPQTFGMPQARWMKNRSDVTATKLDSLFCCTAVNPARFVCIQKKSPLECALLGLERPLVVSSLDSAVFRPFCAVGQPGRLGTAAPL
jgi:hypothetical protein